jgi:hypothetical protein
LVQTSPVAPLALLASEQLKPSMSPRAPRGARTEENSPCSSPSVQCPGRPGIS